ncbi:MAG: 16S rRNA (guanine(527)-N(7))-methyltransferase RsmG [Lachnospiraceae bacterium]|nr:16S rRNA (guanine(527)-N(7))-methyltransferase RsmG [Lachnospiraceae bacterium]
MEVYEKLNIYYQMIVEKNKVMNLTAITDPVGVTLKHFADSLAIASIMDMSQDMSLIDVGTGAGFPGIPIKICFPNIRITLLDSLQKRLNFLDEVIERLGLEEINCIHSRAEDGGRNPDLREKYDIAVSRAVAPLQILSEYCLPYVKVGGAFIAYKSGDTEKEVIEAKNGIRKLGGGNISCQKFTLYDSDIHRSLIKIDKLEATSNFYPRKAGMPSKKPLQ